MNRCTNVDGTPDRVVPIPTTFRTPVNPRPTALWSPIFQAITPDLNVVTPVDGGKTPALLKSLGIQSELNVSWTNEMATPTGPDVPLVAGISSLPENTEEKFKVFLFYFKKPD